MYIIIAIDKHLSLGFPAMHLVHNITILCSCVQRIDGKKIYEFGVCAYEICSSAR